jgi:uncharacterized damage-inducible protein DinB
VVQKRIVSSFLILLCAAALLQRPAGAQPPPELGQGWLPEFTLASRQMLQLAEATPAEKYGWRPAPGVRSIGKVYVHVAIGNLWLLSQAGIKSPELAKVPKDPEKNITGKEDVIAWLRTSLDTVKSAYPSADLQRKVVFFGKDATVEGVFLRILAHDNEHLGQSIAYARMNGIVPPWSK